MTAITATAVMANSIDADPVSRRRLRRTAAPRGQGARAVAGVVVPFTCGLT
jgi:hypothetical protein